jgi:hypothetical protein
MIFNLRYITSAHEQLDVDAPLPVSVAPVARRPPAARKQRRKEKGSNSDGKTFLSDFHHADDANDADFVPGSKPKRKKKKKP